MSEYRMVNELPAEELEQLKSAYYYQLVESDNDVLENIDNWTDIPNEVIYNHYGGITFVPNDFHCEDKWSDEMVNSNLHLFDISADNGATWTSQYMTYDEAKIEYTKGHIIKFQAMQECNGCGKTFHIEYDSNGCYEYMTDVCGCEGTGFSPAENVPSISEWLELIGRH